MRTFRRLVLAAALASSVLLGGSPAYAGPDDVIDEVRDTALGIGEQTRLVVASIVCEASGYLICP